MTPTDVRAEAVARATGMPLRQARQWVVREQTAALYERDGNAPLVEVGQGEYAKPLYPHEVRIENPLRGAAIAIGIVVLFALLFGLAAYFGIGGAL